MSYGTLIDTGVWIFIGFAAIVFMTAICFIIRTRNGPRFVTQSIVLVSLANITNMAMNSCLRFLN